MYEYKVIHKNLVLPVGTELDHHEALKLRRFSDEQFRRCRAKNIILDFKNTHFMDSAGVGMIIGRYKEVDLIGGKIAIININDNIRKLIMISGLHKLVYIYENLEEALAQV